MSSLHYRLLPDHSYEPCSLMEWAEALEEDSWRVASARAGDILVSTVFLGLDHAFDGPPLVFETMIFGGPHDQYQERCSTWEQALEMHLTALALAFPDPKKEREA